MARARNIKPGFFKNEDLAECSAFARLCFAGLWTLADREGRLEDRPKRIKGDLFAYDTVEVDPLLDELVKWKFIERYQVGDVGVIQILAFNKHQNPHFKELPSAFPPPESLRLYPLSMGAKPEASPPLNEPKASDKTEADPPLNPVIAPPLNPVIAPPLNGGLTGLNPESLLLNPESLYPHTPTAGAVAVPSLPGFERFWTAWPPHFRKGGKGKCLDAWRKARAEPIAEQVIAHVVHKKATEDWRKQGGQFIEAPLAYLNGRKWEGAEIDAGGDLIDDLYRGVR